MLTDDLIVDSTSTQRNLTVHYFILDTRKRIIIWILYSSQMETVSYIWILYPIQMETVFGRELLSCRAN